MGQSQLEMYRMMVLIREFEEQVRSAYLGGVVPGMTHLCSGLRRFYVYDTARGTLCGHSSHHFAG